MADSSNDFPTIIGPDAFFKGQLQFEKGVRILGRFDGEINSEGQLLIEEGASLNGDVKAGDIRIDGKVKGNINAKSKVQLTASARLEGDVQAARLEVAEGAVLLGRCMVGVKDERKAAGKTVSAPTASVMPNRPRISEPVRGEAVTAKK